MHKKNNTRVQSTRVYFLKGVVIHWPNLVYDRTLWRNL